MGGMVVIHLHHLTVPFDHMGMAVTCIQIFIGHFRAIFTVVSIDTKTIKGVTNQGGMAAGGAIDNAIAQAVIMLETRDLWMPITVILYFMYRSLASIRIKGAEDHHTRKHNAHFAAHASRLRRRNSVGRQS